MSLVSRLGLTRNEGLYLVFVEATIYAATEKERDGVEKLDAAKDSWAVRGVGYNVQDLIRGVALQCARDGSEAVEARTEYLDRVLREVAVERES